MKPLRFCQIAAKLTARAYRNECALLAIKEHLQAQGCLSTMKSVECTERGVAKSRPGASIEFLESPETCRIIVTGNNGEAKQMLWQESVEYGQIFRAACQRPLEDVDTECPE